MSALKHTGPTIVLAGTAFVVPALSLGTIEKYEEQIDGIEQLPRGQQLRLIVDLAHAALLRNYPDLTRAEVAELVDVRNARQVYAAVMASAIPAADPSEGEVGAMAGGTGLPSTPTSAPVSGGPSTTVAGTSRSTTSKRSRATGATAHPST